MKKNSLLIIKFIFLSIVFFTVDVSYANAQDNLIQSIDLNSIHIKTLLPDSNFNDIEQLRETFKNREVIALGEATHGTHEFYLYKHRLIRFLVEELGFKNLIFETDFAGSQSLNNYILYNKGDPYSGMLDMNEGSFMTQEFLDMIEWLKVYNSNKADNDKVQFLGCDTQGPITCAKEIEKYLVKRKIIISPDLKSGLDTIKAWKFKNTKSYLTIYHNTINTLDKLSFKDTSTTEFEFYKHMIRALTQYINIFENPRMSYRLRDEYMAENSKWLINWGQNKKTVIWAHNDHIEKTPYIGDNKPMGEFLSDNFGDSYYAMGFGYDNGSLRAFDFKKQVYDVFDLKTSLKANSFNYIFKQCQTPNFILDFHNPQLNIELKQFLTKKLLFRSLGAVFYQESDTNRSYINIALCRAFDGIVFIRTTNPAMKLQKWAPSN